MTRRYLQLLIVIGLLVAACALYGAWYAAVGEESAKAVALAQQIAEAKQQDIRAMEAQKELSQASSDEQAIEAYFVRTQDVVSFLESLQETGTRFGSTVEVVSVSNVSTTPHTKLSLSLRIAGPFSSVVRTMGAIEYQPYDTTIDSVTLDTATNDGGAPEWTAAVTLSVGTQDAVATTTNP